jgi:hypothetical protein
MKPFLVSLTGSLVLGQSPLSDLLIFINKNCNIFMKPVLVSLAGSLVLGQSPLSALLDSNNNVRLTAYSTEKELKVCYTAGSLFQISFSLIIWFIGAPSGIQRPNSWTKSRQKF